MARPVEGVDRHRCRSRRFYTAPAGQALTGYDIALQPNNRRADQAQRTAHTVGCVGTFAANLRRRRASRCEGRSTVQ